MRKKLPKRKHPTTNPNNDWISLLPD
ncbi:hypothetical protein LINGRAHAP2_LOCUS17445 [Linum grandiflorum]